MNLLYYSYEYKQEQSETKSAAIQHAKTRSCCMTQAAVYYSMEAIKFHNHEKPGQLHVL